MAGPEEEGFKVTDRRRRADEDESVPPAAPPPRAAESREPSAPGRQPASAAPHPAPGAGVERDLTGLFVMLASSAAMAMGEAPDPLTGDVRKDLDQAAELVDLLLLLREKTEGRRSLEETQVLEELIYDLQVRYVAATKRSGPSHGPVRA